MLLDEAVVVLVQVQLKVVVVDVCAVEGLVVGTFRLVRLGILMGSLFFAGIGFVGTSGTCLVGGGLPALMSSAGLVVGAALRGAGSIAFDWL